MPRYFTEDHEWIEVDGDTATIGITDYAQGQLGDIVFVEVPAAGTHARQGRGSRRWSKASRRRATSIAPVSGTVTEGNAALEDDPALVNTAPESDGWFFKLTIADAGELDGLMDEAPTRHFVAGL